MRLDLPLSPTEQLSLAHDGHVPSHLWDAARAIENTHAEKQRTRARRPHARVVHIKLKPGVAIDLMADTIVRAAAARGCVDRLDLQQAGFSAIQIEAYRDRAFAQAALLEPRIVTMLKPEG